MADGEVAVDLAEKVVGLSVGGREEPQLLAPDGGKVREEPRLSKKSRKDEKRKKLEKKFETLAPQRKPSETHYKYEVLFCQTCNCYFQLEEVHAEICYYYLFSDDMGE